MARTRIERTGKGVGAKELWRPVPGFEGSYEVSNFGLLDLTNFIEAGKKYRIKPGEVLCGKN